MMRNLNRRDFLRLGAASVAVGSSLLLPSATTAQVNGADCVCAGWYPGQWYPLIALAPLLPPPPDRPVRFAYYFWNDAIGFIVENGAPWGLSRDQMWVGLVNRTGWAKQIVAWSLCSGLVNAVYQGGPSTETASMLLSKECGQPGTLVFRKPRFLPFLWYDMYHLEPNLFWQLFGGMRVTFNWAGG